MAWLLFAHHLHSTLQVKHCHTQPKGLSTRPSSNHSCFTHKEAPSPEPRWPRGGRHAIQTDSDCVQKQALPGGGTPGEESSRFPQQWSCGKVPVLGLSAPRTLSNSHRQSRSLTLKGESQGGGLLGLGVQREWGRKTGNGIYHMHM